MEPSRSKATISMSRSSLFTNGVNSPVSPTHVSTYEMGASRSAPKAPARGWVEKSDRLGSSEALSKRQEDSDETGSESHQRDPDALPNRSELVYGETPLFSGQALESVPLSSGESDGSAKRVRAYSAQPVSEAELPPGASVYVAQPYIPDLETEAPHIWTASPVPLHTSGATHPKTVPAAVVDQQSVKSKSLGKPSSSMHKQAPLDASTSSEAQDLPKHTDDQLERAWSEEVPSFGHPMAIRTVNVTKMVQGEDLGGTTPPLKAASPPPASPTFQRAMQEYQKMKALFGLKNSPSEAEQPDAQTGGSDKERVSDAKGEEFEEVDLDERKGEKNEGSQGSLLKWASEGFLKGVGKVSGHSSSDQDRVSQASDSTQAVKGKSHASSSQAGGGVQTAGRRGLLDSWRAEMGKQQDNASLQKRRSGQSSSDGQVDLNSGRAERRTAAETGESDGRGLLPEGAKPAGASNFTGHEASTRPGGLDTVAASNLLQKRESSSGGLPTVSSEGGNKEENSRQPGGVESVAASGLSRGSSGNFPSVSSGGFDDASEMEEYVTVENVPLEEGGFHIKRVKRLRPKQASSRTPSPELARSLPDPERPSQESRRGPEERVLPEESSRIGSAKQSSESELAPSFIDLNPSVSEGAAGVKKEFPEVPFEALKGRQASQKEDGSTEEKHVPEELQRDSASLERFGGDATAVELGSAAESRKESLEAPVELLRELPTSQSSMKAEARRPEAAENSAAEVLPSAFEPHRSSAISRPSMASPSKELPIVAEPLNSYATQQPKRPGFFTGFSRVQKTRPGESPVASPGRSSRPVRSVRNAKWGSGNQGEKVAALQSPQQFPIFDESLSKESKEVAVSQSPQQSPISLSKEGSLHRQREVPSSVSQRDSDPQQSPLFDKILSKESSLHKEKGVRSQSDSDSDSAESEARGVFQPRPTQLTSPPSGLSPPRFASSPFPSPPRLLSGGDLYPYIGYSGEDDPAASLWPERKQASHPVSNLLVSGTTASPPPSNLLISPPRQRVPWSEKSPPEPPSALPAVKLQIEPLLVGVNALDEPLFVGVNAPSKPSEGAFTPPKSVKSRRTQSRGGSQDMTSADAGAVLRTENRTPKADVRSLKADVSSPKADISTPKADVSMSQEGAAFGSFQNRGSPAKKETKASSRGSEKEGDAKETLPKGARGANQVSTPPGNSDHSFTTWLNEKDRVYSSEGGKRSPRKDPPLAESSPRASPASRVVGRTDSELSRNTSDFFADSKASLESPRSEMNEPKLPEFKVPEKYAGLFGAPSTPPSGNSPSRGPSKAGLLLPPGKRSPVSQSPPRANVSKEYSFKNSIQGANLPGQQPPNTWLLTGKSSERGETRDGSSEAHSLNFWPSNQPQPDFPTPPMPGRSNAPPALQVASPIPYANSPTSELMQRDPHNQSFNSQGSSPGLRPQTSNQGRQEYGNPQSSFSSSEPSPNYAGSQLHRDASNLSFESQSSAGSGPSMKGFGLQPQDSVRKKGACHMCGQKSNKKAQCLVCNKKYCERCIPLAMGQMPEGRKCIGCVGQPINEANRSLLGRSDSTIPGLPKERTSAVLKAELSSVSNLAGSERVIVNRKPLTREELASLMNAERPPPKVDKGEFWYDSRSGLWGKTGRHFERLISAALQVGGPLQPDASKGSKRVYINGRELNNTEWRVLKIAGVKLKTGRRLWLDADGAYGEEGGPQKGNLWELKSLHFMLPMLGRPASEVETRLAKEMQQEASKRVIKILLAGPPESGKSAFARHVREMYGEGFSDEQLAELRAMVLANVLHCAKRLLEGRKEKFDDEEDQENQFLFALEPENEKLAESALTRINAALQIAEMEKGKWLTLDLKLATDLQKLWTDPGIQATFKVGGDFSLPDSTGYFMDRLATTSALSYSPSWEDVMACQVLHRTMQSGVTEVDFVIDDPEFSSLSPTAAFGSGVPSFGELAPLPSFGGPLQEDNSEPTQVFRLLDIGPGHLANNPGWRRACEMFEEVSAVLFFVGLSDYDRFTSVSGEYHNRLEDARDLFESLLNSPTLLGKPILLLFNKYDLFCRKLRANISLTECDWLEDYDPGDHATASERFREDVEAQNAYMYIERKFMALVEERNRRFPQAEVSVYKISATDQDSIDMVLQHLPDVVS